MSLFKKHGSGEDAGNWYKLATDPDSGAVVELRIRRLPADIARKLRRQKVKIKGNVTTIDMPEEERRQRAEALACWTASRNLSVNAKDEAAAAAYAKLVPGVSFPVGVDVVVDGALTPELREDILTDFPEVVAFIRRHAVTLQVVDAEEEEDARGN